MIGSFTIILLEVLGKDVVDFRFPCQNYGDDACCTLEVPFSRRISIW